MGLAWPMGETDIKEAYHQAYIKEAGVICTVLTLLYSLISKKHTSKQL